MRFQYVSSAEVHLAARGRSTACNTEVEDSALYTVLHMHISAKCNFCIRQYEWVLIVHCVLLAANLTQE